MRQKLRQAIGITSAVALTGSLLLATPASAAPAPDDTTTTYTSSDFGNEVDGEGWPGTPWFFGATTKTDGTHTFKADGLYLHGTNQILRDLSSESGSEAISKADLKAAINSFEVEDSDNSGDWAVQIPVNYDVSGTDSDFTTLRPGAQGKFSTGDAWKATTGSYNDRVLTGTYANLNAALDDVYAGTGDVNLLGYGFLVDSGTNHTTIKSSTWQGEKSVFETEAQQLGATYAPKRATPSVAQTSAPSFTDDDGNAVAVDDLPAGTTFATGTVVDGTGSASADTHGVVTYTPDAGDSGVATVPVTITYAATSSDAEITADVEAKFDVRVPLNALTATYADTAATPGVEATSPAPTFTGGPTDAPVDMPDGTTFALDTGAPGSGATIDDDTGEVTYNPAPGVGGTMVPIPVKITYPDASTSSVEANFDVAENSATLLTPEYADKDAAAGSDATSPPSFTDSDGEAVDAPEGTTFEARGSIPAGAAIDTNTGEVTYTSDSGDAGDTVSVPVRVKYPDGSTDGPRAKFIVKDATDVLTTEYADTDAAVGVDATSSPSFTDTDDEAVDTPTGTTFAIDGTEPGATIDSTTGEVTYTPSLSEAGTTVTVSVVITYPDATEASVDANFNVAETSDVVLTPSYADTNAAVGTAATSEAPSFTDSDGAADAPEDTTFALGSSAPSDAAIDASTGEVTYTPSVSDGGKTVTVPVDITYPDTTTASVDAKFNVGDATADVMTPSYTSTNVFESGVAVTSAPKFSDTNGDEVTAPAGTKYTFPLGESGHATINEDTGVVTFTAASGDRGTTLRYIVKVDYPDGSTKNVGAAFAVAYRDVVSSNDFAGDIAWLADEGITTGYTDGTFRPRGHVTREAMAAFLYRADNGEEVAYPLAPFTDVDPSSPFYHEINWAFAEEITTGYPDQTYRPKNHITREAMAAFLYRVADGANHPGSGDESFNDISNSPFQTEIKWLADNGISTGYSDDTFRPKNEITREAMAAFIHRMDEKGLFN